MKFEFDNNSPIYIQLVRQIEINIISGEIKPGERLPSVRDLAIQTKVNPNTMQKALSELEETGLIFTERTNGKFATSDTALIQKRRREYARALSQQYIMNMKNIGFSKAEAIDHLKEWSEENE